jgi:MFS family permease
MLDTLKLGYLEYMALVASAVAAKFAATPLHGRFAERHGVKALMWLGAVGTIPTSAMWILSDDFGWLLFAQIWAGVAWSAWELATLLTFFESIPHEERTSVLTCHNFANACAVALGSLAGAALLQGIGGGAQALLWLFGISSLLRISTLVLLRRVGPPPTAASVLENARTFKWSR